MTEVIKHKPRVQHKTVITRMDYSNPLIAGQHNLKQNDSQNARAESTIKGVN